MIQFSPAKLVDTSSDYPLTIRTDLNVNYTRKRGSNDFRRGKSVNLDKLRSLENSKFKPLPDIGDKFDIHDDEELIISNETLENKILLKEKEHFYDSDFNPVLHSFNFTQEFALTDESIVFLEKLFNEPPKEVLQTMKEAKELFPDEILLKNKFSFDIDYESD